MVKSWDDTELELRSFSVRYWKINLKTNISVHVCIGHVIHINNKTFEGKEYIIHIISDGHKFILE